MKRIKKYAKTTLCMALSAAMLFMDMGAPVSAVEYVQEETQNDCSAEENSVGTEEAPIVVMETQTEESETISEDETIAETMPAESELESASETEEVQPEESASETVTESELESETESMEVQPEESDPETVTESELKSEVENAESVNAAFSDTDIAHGEYKENGNDITWTISADGKLTVEGTGNFLRDYYSDEDDWFTHPSWSQYREKIITAEIKVTGMTDARCMLADCTNLTSVDVSGLDTSKVTNMALMFYNCKSLKELNLSSFDTRNVLNMDSMVAYCESLETLNLSSFDTRNVSDMGYMFGGCTSLKELNLSSFDTRNVADMYGMFENCESLKELDLSSFDTRNVSDMDRMFYGCESLKELDLSSFDTSNVIRADGMFSYALEKLYTPRKMQVEYVGLGNRMYDMEGNEYRYLPTNREDSILLRSSKEPEAVDAHITAAKEKRTYVCGETLNTDDITVRYYGTDGSVKELAQTEYTINAAEIDMNTEGEKILTVTYNDITADIKLTVSKKEESSGGDTDNTDIAHGEYKENGNNITWTISADGKLTVKGKGDFLKDYLDEEYLSSKMQPSWFPYRGRILSAEIKVTGMTDASFMLTGCTNLKSVDVSGLDTSKVTNMAYMFYGCISLKEVDLSSFDTSKVTKMNSMFECCDSLTNVNLSSFDTGNLTDMSVMFDCCPALRSLDLSSFDASNVTSAGWMFIGCYLDKLYTPRNLKLEDINVSGTVGDWQTMYDMEGNAYEYLPANRKDSILLQSGNKPVDAHITAVKGKRMYVLGETLNTDDITVRYYGTDGSVKELAQTEYTTNAAEIDMSTEGEKTLTITYNDMTVNIKLTVSKKVETGTNDERPSITESGVLFPKKKDSYSAVYTGEKICPTMTVTYAYQDSNGKPKTQTLKLNVDYTVTYTNNINVGETATVTVKGIGEYQGTVTKEFTITQKSISKVTLSAVGDIRYEDIKNGEKPKVTVMDGTKELVEGTDYTLSWTEGNADTTTVSTLTVKAVEGKPCNYTGVANKKPTFNILGKDAGNALSIASDNIIVEWKNPNKTYIYNGKEQKPAVVVTDKESGKKISSSYYKVIYTNNVNAGTEAEAYVVGVTKKGAGYYGRSKSLKFTIDQKSFSKVSASIKGTLPKSGTISDIQNAINEAVVVKDGKTILSYGEDYTIDYGEINSFDSIKTGTNYVITISPAGTGGNYAPDPKKPKTLKIKFGQLNLASKTATTSLTITNVDQKKVTLTYNGKTLEQDKDYEVASIKQDKKTGLYTVQIKAVKGSAYKGSLTFKGLQALSLTLNKERITGKMGETVHLKAAIPSGVQYSAITWKSSNPSVATVTDKGVVSLVGSGEAVITASTSAEQLELTAQCQVAVNGELKNFVSVTDFGAVPDDGEDDQDAFSKAFDALGREDYEGYDTVYVPEGTYHIEPEYGIVMPSNTKLYMNEDAVLQALKCSNHENQVIAVYGSDVEISGGTIIGELRATGKDGESGMGIRIQLAQNVYIHDVNIKECRGDGIYIGGNGKGSTNIRIIDCTIADCSRNCLGIVSAHEVYVDGCTITGAGSLFGGKAPRACILIEKNSGDDICTDIEIKNSTVDNKAVCSKQSEAYAFGSAWINWPNDPVIQGDRLTVENCTFKGKVVNYSVTNAKFINCTFDGKTEFKQGTVVQK